MEEAATSSKSRATAKSLSNFALAWLVASALLLLTYSPALRGDFVWDDDRHVSQNLNLRDASGLIRIWFEPGSTPQYYPLTHTTFWIEHHLWGNATLGYHIDNVLLHALSAVLAWGLMKRLQIPGAMFIAAVWALHPLQVESVAWISERKNCLSFVFYLLALKAFLHYEEESAAALARRSCLAPAQLLILPYRLQVRRRFWIASLLFFLLAMLSKTVACSMPAVALLLIIWKNRRLTKQCFIALIPFFAIGISLSALTAWMERSHVGATGSDWQISSTDRLNIAARAIWFYASNFLFPLRLCFSYPRWSVGDHHAWRFAFTALLLVIALTLAKLRRSGLFISVTIFVGVLFPALGFFNTYPMRYSFVADHFQYMAGLTLAALLGAALARFRTRIGAIAILAVLAILTFRQAKTFAGPVQLWQSVIKANPDSWLAHHNLGVQWSIDADPSTTGGRAQLEAALREFDEVERLRPSHERLAMSRANALAKLHRWPEAIASYRQWLAIAPSSFATPRGRAVAYESIADCLEQLNDFVQMEANLRLAITADPSWVVPHQRLVVRFEATQRWSEAVEQFQAIVKLDPKDVDAWTAMGAVNLKLGNLDAAATVFQQAIRLDPAAGDARRGLAEVDAERRQK